MSPSHHVAKPPCRQGRRRGCRLLDRISSHTSICSTRVPSFTAWMPRPRCFRCAFWN